MMKLMKHKNTPPPPFTPEARQTPGSLMTETVDAETAFQCERNQYRFVMSSLVA